MSPNPISFLAHLQERGYHPRSDKHSNALGEAIVGDLVRHCPKMRAKASDGKLVYDLNFTLSAGTAEWNVDVVMGAPALDAETDGGTELPIGRQRPSTVEVAIEIKSVMTEHRKAVKNRKRDLEAHHEHVHNYNRRAVAGGVLVVNAAERFRSPLRPEPTVHKNPLRLVEHCINELRSVTVRGGPKGYGLEGRCAIVVEIENFEDGEVSYVTAPPAPQVGDPLHYDAFIQALCQHYEERF